MSEVIDITAAILARRDEEHRRRFQIQPHETASPIGYLAARLMDRVKIQMAEKRNREAVAR
ncbi:hypothetical protein [Bosea sp. NPDC055594]